MYRLVILDRDGVLTREKGHVRSIRELEVLPEVGKAVALLNGAGVKVVIATNQSGVARGYLSLDELAEIHTEMLKQLAAEGGLIDEIYVAPTLPPDADCEGCVEEYVTESEDRKPGAGMLIRAMAEFGVKPEQVCMVGDSGKDRDAAARAGVDFHGIHSAKFIELQGETLHESLMELVNDFVGKNII